MGLNAHCRVKFVCADLRLRFLRLSTIKKCPQMLRSDHRELRNSKVKLGWVVGGGGGGGGVRERSLEHIYLPITRNSVQSYVALSTHCRAASCRRPVDCC